MSADTVDLIKYATNQCNIYAGFFLFSIGMIGNVLNMVIFSSLKTFRETSAALYMNITSGLNIFQLVFGLLSRILITGYNIDLTITSSFFCKLRQFILITTMLIIFTCMCFAAIDQYVLYTNRWRHLCSLHVASRLVITAFIIWILHGIPIFFYQNVYFSLDKNQKSCTTTNTIYTNYSSHFLFPVLLGFLPLIIRITFGVLAFTHVRRLQARQVPIVRLERDKQLTAMVLVEVAIDVIMTLPYIIYNHLYSSTAVFSNPISIAQNQLFMSVTRIFFYGNFAIAFYIYCCVSARFRHQLVYVLVQIHLKYWRDKMHRRQINRVVPQITIDINSDL